MSGALRFVAVIGPTGSGKSALAVELAAALRGEVVNADVIQMYRGLDIASAKITAAAARGVPHHLLSFLSPREPFSVLDFHRLARAAIADIGARGKLPVVVGGTLYYVQSLLRPSLLADDEALALAEAEDADGAAPPAAAAAATYERLCAVDAVMARRLHAHDSRKIARALAVYDKTGVPYSTLLLRQAARLRAEAEAAAAADDGGAAAAAATHVLWTTVSDRAAHRARLDARVDGMLADGLLGELQRLRAALAGGGDAALAAPPGALAATELTLRLLRERPLTFAAPDEAAAAAIAAQHEGLLQAIGYKEFEPWLAAADAGAAPAALDAALGPCVAALRAATARYARVQEKFIRNRLWKRGVPLVQLETAPPPHAASGAAAGWWQAAVSEPALRSVQAWLAHAPPPLPPLPLPPAADAASPADRLPYADDATRVHSWDKRACAACSRELNGLHEWERHLASRAHARATRRLQREQAAAAAAAAAATSPSAILAPVG